MNPLRSRSLQIAIAAALSLAVLAPVASAQEGTQSLRDQRTKRLAQLGKGDVKKDEKEKKPALYPNATRISPTPAPSPKMLKLLLAVQDAYEKQEMQTVITEANALGANPDAGAYEKSAAYSLAANASIDLGDEAKAAEYFRKAVDTNGLDNDSHFNTLFNLAVIQYQLEKYQDALATVDTFLAQSKSEKSEHLGFRAGLLANLDRNEEAAAVYKAMMAKNPDDKRILMNAVATLQGAGKFDESNVLLEDAYRRGMLTDGKELRALYVGYMNAERWSDAKAVIDAGTANGTIEPSVLLAKDYMVLAQNAYAEDNPALAIELYTKAGPIAADGEAYLNLAKILEITGKKAASKVAAQKALDKGLKKPQDAKRLLSL